MKAGTELLTSLGSDPSPEQGVEGHSSEGDAGSDVPPAQCLDTNARTRRGTAVWTHQSGLCLEMAQSRIEWIAKWIN